MGFECIGTVFFDGNGNGANYSSGSGFNTGTGFGDGCGLGDADRLNPRSCCFAFGYGTIETKIGTGSGHGTDCGCGFLVCNGGNLDEY